MRALVAALLVTGCGADVVAYTEQQPAQELPAVEDRTCEAADRSGPYIVHLERLSGSCDAPAYVNADDLVSRPLGAPADCTGTTYEESESSCSHRVRCVTSSGQPWEMALSQQDYAGDELAGNIWIGVGGSVCSYEVTATR